MKYFICISLFLLSSLDYFAQNFEEVVPLRNNETLISELKNNSSSNKSNRDIDRKPFIYIVDTLELPFFDDFTKNKIKVYNATKTDENISLKVLFGFEVNGEHPETLDLVYTQTYSKTKPISGPIQFDPNPILYVTFYNENGEAISADTGWTNIVTEFDEGQGLVSYDTLEPDQTFINTFDTLYLVADDNSHWITPGDESGRGGAYINNNLQKDNLTQGVATFDGIDAVGTPYNIESETAQGPADTLESKPFNLDPEMEDVFLSFFYQAGGHGNEPEVDDTLVLEFFDVTNQTWRHAWSRAGGLDEPGIWSEQVWLRVSEFDFLQPGFQFRFRNYATLSGMFDLWHLDYIRLGAERDSVSEDTITDVSILSGLTSFTGEFTSVPYSHYLNHFDILQADTVNLDVRNIGVLDANVLNINYEISDDQGNQIDFFTTADLNLPKQSVRRYQFLQGDEQIFPDVQKEYVDFNFTAWYAISGNNDENINDTIRGNQRFWKYYSYDDGTAEQAYALTGAGIELAYEFNTPEPDSLRGLWINFPRVLVENAEDFELELMVWEDTASDPIYTSEIPISPKYSDGNEFTRYDFFEPIYITGTFYVGYRQLQSDKVYIGFDKNTNAREHILYRTGDKWFKSSFDGSLLMRPDFGVDPSLGIEEKKKTQSEFDMYPNPAKNFITIDPKNRNSRLDIYSMSGQIVKTEMINSKVSVNISDLSTGIYMLRLIDLGNGIISTNKLVVANK